MNYARRNELKEADNIISKVISTLKELIDEKNECKESLRNSRYHEKSEIAIAAIESAVDSLEEAQGAVEDAEL